MVLRAAEAEEALEPDPAPVVVLWLETDDFAIAEVHDHVAVAELEVVVTVAATKSVSAGAAIERAAPLFEPVIVSLPAPASIHIGFVDVILKESDWSDTMIRSMPSAYSMSQSAMASGRVGTLASATIAPS